MIPMKKHCKTCPWTEPENVDDMIDLLEVQKEEVWPCHETSTFSEGDYGEIIYLVEEPRNRECFGYLQFVKMKDAAK